MDADNFACDGAEGFTGTALASVPGGKAGFPDSRVLLVNSCVQGTQINLLFIDASPGASDAASFSTEAFFFFTELKKTITTDLSRERVCCLEAYRTMCWTLDTMRMGGVGASPRQGGSARVRQERQCDRPLVDRLQPLQLHARRNGDLLAQRPEWLELQRDRLRSERRLGVPGADVGAQRLPHVEHGRRPGASRRAAAAGCASLTGLGIAGTSLFVACTSTGAGTPPPRIAQLYKANGSLVRQFSYSCPDEECPPAPQILRGVTDDPASFGGNIELLWTMTNDFRFIAFEMAAGTLGQRTGSPVLAPGSCPAAFGGNMSSDGDDLLDCWKNPDLWSDGKPGINYAGTYALGSSPATRDVTLCVNERRRVQHSERLCQDGAADLFLEIDSMDFHKPDTATGAVPPSTLVIQMFKNAPNSNSPVSEPYAGIALHVQIDELVSINGVSHWANVAFGRARRPPRHGHHHGQLRRRQEAVLRDLRRARLAEPPSPTRSTPRPWSSATPSWRTTCSASAPPPAVQRSWATTSSCPSGAGGRRIPTGKTVSHGVGTLDQLSGTLAHEFGHTVGLRHGGGDNINCKSNYPSVMNYNHQFFKTRRPGSWTTRASSCSCSTRRRSTKARASASARGSRARSGTGRCPRSPRSSWRDAGGPIDWNKNNVATDTGVNRDLPQTTSSTGGCPATQAGAPGNELGQFLDGFDDWANIRVRLPELRGLRRRRTHHQW